MSFRDLSDKIIGTINKALGEEVVYTPNGSDAVTINAIFDYAWVEVEQVSSLRPILRIRLSDLDSAPAKGDQVEARDVTYNVSDSQLDGHGGSTLILKKV